MGAELLVSDDADAFKQVADALGVWHQVCKSHVLRNTEQLVCQLRGVLEGGSDGSLEALGISREQALADLARLLELVRARRAGEAVAEVVGAVCGSVAASSWGAGERSVSDAFIAVGPLASLGSLGSVSVLGGCWWGAYRRHEQRLRACDRLVGEGALSDNAWF